MGLLNANTMSNLLSAIKEVEMKSLKAQYVSLQTQLQQQSDNPTVIVETTPWMFSILPKIPLPFSATSLPAED